jgi:hypothetical protein
MVFEGCKGHPCKCAALGVICLCAVAATSQHDQFCEQQHRPAYCNLAWDLPHGPHNDHQGQAVRLSLWMKIITLEQSIVIDHQPLEVFAGVLATAIRTKTEGRSFSR